MGQGNKNLKRNLGRNKSNVKTKQVKSKTDGKVYTVTSTDGGKTWGNKTPFTGNLLAARLGISQHGKTNTKSTKSKSKITRAGGQKTNEEIFGKKKVDALKIKHAAWKQARKEGTLKEWEKKYKPKKKRRMGVDPNEY